MSEDWVYFTAGGGRWHERADCEALVQGQAEAAGKGLPNHPVQRVPRSRVGNRTACGCCVMSDTSSDNVQPMPPLDNLKTETEYERVFADRVLQPLAEMSAWTVEAQKSIIVNGKTYRPDFALTLPPLRIAIEIDGKDKGPGGADHDAWTRRQTALVNAGWEVLRFTNRQVMHEQEYCRRQVAVAVARLQERQERHSASPAQSSPSATAPTRAPTPTASGNSGPRRAGLVVAGVVAAVAVGALVLSGSGGSGQGPVPPTAGDRYPCPASQPIKGNVSQSGERIYHQRGDAFYERTAAEKCFPDAAAAEAAGFRAAKR